MTKANPLTKIIMALAFASGGEWVADYPRHQIKPRKVHKTDPAIVAELEARAEAKRERKAKRRRHQS